MATIAAIEAALQTDYSADIGTGPVIRIQQAFTKDATYTDYYVTSQASNLTSKAGWVQCTTADAAGDQADDIRTALGYQAPEPNIGP